VFPLAQQLRVLVETRRFSVVEETVTRPDGRSACLQYVKHPGSVAVLPLLDDGRVCLIHSRRLTVGETLIEVPAGTCEPNERPLETARRELAEETGYRAAQFDELATFYPSPGITDERMWLFVARGLLAGDPAREDNEEIENLLLTWPEALEMIENGQIRDAKTIVALLMYRNFERRNV
jgi:ADP-ribose pyrophosphatase